MEDIAHLSECSVNTCMPFCTTPLRSLVLTIGASRRGLHPSISTASACKRPHISPLRMRSCGSGAPLRCLRCPCSAGKSHADPRTHGRHPPGIRRCCSRACSSDPDAQALSARRTPSTGGAAQRTLSATMASASTRLPARACISCAERSRQSVAPAVRTRFPRTSPLTPSIISATCSSAICQVTGCNAPSTCVAAVQSRCAGHTTAVPHTLIMG